MLKIVADIKTKSDWLLKFQLKKSAKKVENFQLFFPPTFSALFSDIAKSCLNCACTPENLNRIFSLLWFFCWTENGFKPTFSGVCSNINSFTANEYKHGLIFTLLFWIFSIVSNFSKFQEEVNYLKDVLKKNSFPTNLVDKCIKIFLNKQFSHKIFKHTVPKRELFIMSPYLGITSLCFRLRLQRSINSNISLRKIKIILKSSTRLANFF